MAGTMATANKAYSKSTMECICVIDTNAFLYCASKPSAQFLKELVRGIFSVKLPKAPLNTNPAKANAMTKPICWYEFILEKPIFFANVPFAKKATATLGNPKAMMEASALAN